MGIRLGPIIITTEGVLLLCALVVFLGASYRRLRGQPLMPVSAAIGLLGAASLCGLLGAALYGIPGTMAILREDSALPMRAAISFGSFGGYWGVLLGGALAAMAMRRPILPILDSLTPGILLGGAVARAEVLFQATPSPFPTLAWAAADITVQAALAAFIIIRIRGERGWPPGTGLTVMLLGYGIARLLLELLRDHLPLMGVVTWGHAMSAIQILAGGVLLIVVNRRRCHP